MLGDRIDGGAILKQVEFPIALADTSSDLEKAVRDIIVRELPEIGVGYLEGRITAKPQSGEESRTGLWERYKKILPAEETALDIYNKVLHYPEVEPFADAYLLVRGRKVYLQGSRFFVGNNADAMEQGCTALHW